MQYVTTRPVLNVEECDRLSFMPWMFGADFMLAE
ncbi:TPA: antirestriction protein, partial [Klebsiella pneumoniae]